MDNSLFAITKKHQKCIAEAIWQAQKSPCLHKHGCVISGGGRICGRGYNNYRTYSSDGLLNNCCTCHAEIAAIRSCARFGHIRGVEQRERGKKGRYDESYLVCC